jgi:trans-aconitate 2-methyltransferase
MDSSPAMIETAQAKGPKATWVCADAATWQPGTPCHAVFSNAALQWIPDQAALLKSCMDWLVPGGVLAIQVPGNSNSGLHRAMHHTAARWPRRERFAGLADQIVYHEPDFYHERLERLSPLVQVWETTYWHVLDNFRAMIDWYAGTGLRPWLLALDNDVERQVFCEQMLEEIRQVYTARADGRVYFHFRRIFATAVKPGGKQ